MNTNDTFNDCKRLISPFVESQFPEIYKENAQALIDFVKAYYEFEEETKYQFLNQSSCMREKSDIDTTIDEFVVYFKSKYMKDMPFANAVENRFIIKNIFDLYQSKGTERSLKLLMRLMYGIDPEVYYPGQDVLRASHSIWYQPRYLEVSQSKKTKALIGKKIYGQLSKATAFVESIVTKRINGRVFDVLYLSDVRGEFSSNEYLTDGTGDFFDQPFSTGSLTSIELATNGSGFKVGDIFDVQSESGDFGIAKVSEVSGVQPKIYWSLIDGGYGFAPTVDAIGNPLPNTPTKVYVSDSVLAIANSGLQDQDIVTQYLETLTLDAPVTAVVGDIVSAGALTDGTVVSTSGNDVVVQYVDSFAASSPITVGGISYNLVSAVDNSVTATVMESDADYVWLYNTQNGPFLPIPLGGTGLASVEDQNGTAYNVSIVFKGSGATFELLTITDVESISFYTDAIKDLNVFGVQYLITTLNSTDFGFPKPNAVAAVSDLATKIEDALGIAITNIGTPSSLAFVDPGLGYNIDAKAKVVTSPVAASNYKDLIFKVVNFIGYAVGQIITQSNGAKGTIISVDSTNNEIVVRPTSFMNQFYENQVTTVSVSGISFIPDYIVEDTTSSRMGQNMIITGKASAFGGAVAATNVIVSGFGFRDGEEVIMLPQGVAGASIRGIARLGTAGKSAGVWKTTTSQVNWDTYIHDNDYYQEYSYEVSAPTDLDKYKDVVENVVHVAGTKVFGKVVKRETFVHDYTWSATLEII